MKQILVTANDTGVGKTWVSAELVRDYLAQGLRVGYVKVVETGVLPDGDGDAEAVQAVNPSAICETLLRFREPLAPLAAASLQGAKVSIRLLTSLLAQACPDVDVRIIEGAGGVAVPLDPDSGDWLTYAQRIGVDQMLVVIEDRLGAINQTRLLQHYLHGCGIPYEIRLNCIGEVDGQVREVNRKAIEAGNQKAKTGKVLVRGQSLEERRRTGMFRELRVHQPAPALLNLSGNDYLGLARHPKVVEAAQMAADRWGCSASASPLVTGYLPVHRDLERALCKWHGFPFGMVWTAGFQANRAVLSQLPQKGDLVLADRLVHRSMLSGALQAGADFRRYRHLDLGHLEDLLRAQRCTGQVFVATESVFSMDGDAPALQRLAELRDQYGFTWILDEAHGLGWYGTRGAGLAEAAWVGESVDILVGTLGKALGSQGAYVLFREETFREQLVNFSEDFIYSTYLAPTCAAAAMAAVEIMPGLQDVRAMAQAGSRQFRTVLQAVLPSVPDGDSPIVPIILGDADTLQAAHQRLLDAGILTGCIRPPTVPSGTSRLRISLQAHMEFKTAGQTIAAQLGKRVHG